MRTKHWFGLGVLVIFLIPVSMMAQYGPHHEMKMEKLNLTEQQEDQLEEYATAHHKQMIQLKADMQVARLELREALVSGGSDKEVNNAADKVADAQKALLQERIRHQLQVRKLIGEEKFEDFMEMRGPRGGRGCNSNGPGMQRPHRPGMRHPGMMHGQGQQMPMHQRWDQQDDD